MSKRPLIHFLDEQPYDRYRDYAFAVHKIKETLLKETGFEFTMYADDETSNEMWEILEEDLLEEQTQVELVAPVFDTIETATISSNHTDKALELIIKPRLINSLYYYPNFATALVRIPIFQAHGDVTHDFIFSKDNHTLQQYLQYILKRKRDYIKNHVTVFLDTENGVESKKEKITTLVTRDDVFLEEHMKQQIYRSIDEFFLNSGEFFTKFNIPYKRGILLYGKPGNGKTTLVKSIANSITAPVAYWQITEFTSSYSIQEVFSAIAKMAPMALIIEDIDSMPREVRSFFLNTLDGATSKEGIFIIGTTNYPERIDPALINRAGRFDRAYEIKLPNEQMRFEYLLKKELNQVLPLEQITEASLLTDGFSFAQLNELYTAVVLEWHYENKVDLHRICEELKSANKKSKSHEWETEDAKLGF
ncbi:ATP-binding protein [Alkalihalobacillus sp. LMS39]|uniref:ATP-binding protein n=1 Tax=Alkalihalobacillus sp. LMS39 TaxID=2924032 RepID=UPI001FB24002|nr:ATP-binding protein [Alkalihalobacillus sp. LMS39]UOE92209.1 ATP-binding protein [Alkalihalobacillus sp. LMS39]